MESFRGTEFIQVALEAELGGAMPEALADDRPKDAPWNFTRIANYIVAAAVDKLTEYGENPLVEDTFGPALTNTLFSYVAKLCAENQEDVQTHCPQLPGLLDRYVLQSTNQSSN